MEQESYADFSIIKEYFELKNRYNQDIQQCRDEKSSIIEKYQQQTENLQKELTIKTDHINMLESQIQDMEKKIKEKDEMLKNLGFQLHRVKGELEHSQSQFCSEEGDKKSIFDIFK